MEVGELLFVLSGCMILKHFTNGQHHMGGILI